MSKAKKVVDSSSEEEESDDEPVVVKKRGSAFRIVGQAVESNQNKQSNVETNPQNLKAQQLAQIKALGQQIQPAINIAQAAEHEQEMANKPQQSAEMVKAIEIERQKQEQVKKAQEAMKFQQMEIAKKAAEARQKQESAQQVNQQQSATLQEKGTVEISEKQNQQELVKERQLKLQEEAKKRAMDAQQKAKDEAIKKQQAQQQQQEEAKKRAIEAQQKAKDEAIKMQQAQQKAKDEAVKMQQAQQQQQEEAKKRVIDAQQKAKDEALKKQQQEEAKKRAIEAQQKARDEAIKKQQAQQQTLVQAQQEKVLAQAQQQKQQVLAQVQQQQTLAQKQQKIKEEATKEQQLLSNTAPVQNKITAPVQNKSTIAAAPSKNTIAAAPSKNTIAAVQKAVAGQNEKTSSTQKPVQVLQSNATASAKPTLAGVKNVAGSSSSATIAQAQPGNSPKQKQTLGSVVGQADNKNINANQPSNTKATKVEPTSLTSGSDIKKNIIKSVAPVKSVKVEETMAPAQSNPVDINGNHPIKEDESWKTQYRVKPVYEIQKPGKMEIPELMNSSFVKATVIAPIVSESSKVKWNEFPEEPVIEIEHGQKTKIQDWVPVNDEEKPLLRAAYKPSKIGSVQWPPQNENQPKDQQDVLKIKANDDTAWIQSQEQLSETPIAWQQKVAGGEIKSRAWPPPSSEVLRNGYQGPNHMPVIQWPPPAFEEHQHEIVEVITTHLPVHKKETQWPPEPPKMVPAGTVQYQVMSNKRDSDDPVSFVSIMTHLGKASPNCQKSESKNDVSRSSRAKVSNALEASDKVLSTGFNGSRHARSDSALSARKSRDKTTVAFGLTTKIKDTVLARSKSREPDGYTRKGFISPSRRNLRSGSSSRRVSPRVNRSDGGMESNINTELRQNSSKINQIGDQLVNMETALLNRISHLEDKLNLIMKIEDNSKNNTKDNSENNRKDASFSINEKQISDDTFKRLFLEKMKNSYELEDWIKNELKVHDKDKQSDIDVFEYDSVAVKKKNDKHEKEEQNMDSSYHFSIASRKYLDHIETDENSYTVLKPTTRKKSPESKFYPQEKRVRGNKQYNGKYQEESIYYNDPSYSTKNGKNINVEGKLNLRNYR
uniref:EF-hand domain-containing protein n=1 Tax=Rhabditophanes sp. KR3021 TaxID=114890 RepID=A0AC35UGW2_9BILA